MVNNDSKGTVAGPPVGVKDISKVHVQNQQVENCELLLLVGTSQPIC